MAATLWHLTSSCSQIRKCHEEWSWPSRSAKVHFIYFVVEIGNLVFGRVVSRLIFINFGLIGNPMQYSYENIRILPTVSGNFTLGNAINLCVLWRNNDFIGNAKKNNKRQSSTPSPEHTRSHVNASMLFWTSLSRHIRFFQQSKVQFQYLNVNCLISLCRRKFFFEKLACRTENASEKWIIQFWIKWETFC